MGFSATSGGALIPIIPTIAPYGEQWTGTCL